MRSLNQALKALGFNARYDYRLEDHGDGKGPVLVWLSDQPQPTLKDIQDARKDVTTDLIAHAADARWQREQGGITLPGGVEIATDTAAQTKISAAKSAFDNGALTGSIAFKAVNGWMDADDAAVTAVYQSVVNHVQACYAKEREVVAEIASGTITSPEQIDAAFGAL